MLYPSWSWMRWDGETCGPSWKYEAGLQQKLFRTELDFYRLMSDERVELLAPRDPPTSRWPGQMREPFWAVSDEIMEMPYGYR